MFINWKGLFSEVIDISTLDIDVISNKIRLQQCYLNFNDPRGKHLR